MTERRDFEARADAIGSIRSYVQQSLLRHGVTDEAIDAAVLCTSELATNALLHGDGGIGVDLDVRRGSRARVVVTDANPADPQPRRATAVDESGRGLLLVSTFADDWGVEPRPDGKAVWFEIDLRGQPAAPPARTADERRRWHRPTSN